MNRDQPLATLTLAAGMGTRMKSDRPKVLHEICGKPMIYYLADLVRELGTRPNVIVLGFQHEKIRSALSDAPFAYAIQEQQKGTGHAARVGMEQIKSYDGQVLILYGDVPLLQAETLLKAEQRHRAINAAVTVLTMRPEAPSGYGRILRESTGQFTEIREARDASAAELAIGECNSGIYLVSSDFLHSTLDRIQPNNDQEEYYLTDIVKIAVDAGLNVETFLLPDAQEAEGVNDRIDLARVEGVMRSRINESHLRAGVTMTDPKRTYVEASVQIGAETVMEPDVIIKGTSQIGDHCLIESGARVLDSHIEAGCVIRSGSVIEGSLVGAGSTVGPMAHLRHGTVLGKEVRVGNFVETKKTKIGDRTKASHLTYLGDSDIGSDANIGCGTITCNYDGVEKHKTIIGDGVFVGSDTQLVAPVKIGDRAYIGSGSTITKDVPAEALAVSRPHQENIEGWVTRKNRDKKEKGK